MAKSGDGSTNNTIKRATSIDVAHLAGVSQSTVSRAFSGGDGPGVSPKTRQKILLAAKKLGYEPNAIARSLITQRSGIVGIVMGYITAPFYALVLEKFTQKLHAIGHRVLLFTPQPGQEVDEILPLVLQYQVSGLIITSATLSSRMANECARNETPVILFNRYVFGASASAVSCDNAAGGRAVADLLVDTGHQRLAFIAGRFNSSTNLDREKGFTDRLRERGQSEWLREQGSYTYQSGYEATGRLFQRDDPPDAIFCADDTMALGAIDRTRELGIRVPEDVSIVGFDDIPTASWLTYSLTTIRQPVDQMVDLTLELLNDRIESPTVEPVLKFLPGTLIKRRTVRMPPNLTAENGNSSESVLSL